MHSWSTDALLNAVIGPVPYSNDEKAMKVCLERKEGVRNFTERVY